MKEPQLKLFSGSSNPELVRKIADGIGIPTGEVVVNSFPDGETFVRYNENIRGDDVFIVQSTSAPANHHIMELLIMIDAARRASASRITAVMPFYGYARQDRKDQPRVPITSKLVANLLVASGANRILTMDLHAQQIQGFFDIPVDHLYASPVVYDYLRSLSTENLTVISPDVGGMKMAAAYADLLGAHSVVGDVRDCDVLIVDDMTETAGTLVAASKLLREHGARRIFAAVSHGTINDIGVARLRESPVDELITTDTTRVQVDDLPVTVLSVAPILGEAIKRIHGNSSVTSLFQIKGY
jgi:ribose-phosphate pyrophosphokinase